MAITYCEEMLTTEQDQLLKACATDGWGLVDFVIAAAMPCEYFILPKAKAI
jgi:hypothetical protein